MDESRGSIFSAALCFILVETALILETHRFLSLLCGILASLSLKVNMVAPEA